MKKIMISVFLLISLLSPLSVSAGDDLRPEIEEISPLGAVPGEVIMIHGQNFIAPLSPGEGASNLVLYYLLHSRGVGSYNYYSPEIKSWKDTLVRFQIPPQVEGKKLTFVICVSSTCSNKMAYNVWNTTFLPFLSKK